MTARTVALKIHLYLGLVTGLVLAVVCATGALLSFEDELTEALHPERYVARGTGERLPLDEVVRRVGAALPDVTVGGITVHTEPGRTLEMPVGRGDTLYVDPHTGGLIERVVYLETGFGVVFALHRWLLGDDIGKLIVGVCTLAFVFIVITGVWVWWPKDRRQLRKRTRVATGRGWQRLNYDLHVSLGIWTAVFLFVMAFTGLQWSFGWFNDAMHAVAGREAAPSQKPEPAPRAETASISLDAVHATAAAAVPSPWYRIGLPDADGGAFAVRVLPDDAAHHYASDVLYVDPYGAGVVGRDRAGDRAGGAQLRLWFHLLHFGTIGGWPTRIIWFLAAALGATFPITGAIIWINRHRKRWGRRWRAWRARGEAGDAQSSVGSTSASRR